MGTSVPEFLKLILGSVGTSLPYHEASVHALQRVFFFFYMRCEEFEAARCCCYMYPTLSVQIIFEETFLVQNNSFNHIDIVHICLMPRALQVDLPELDWSIASYIFLSVEPRLDKKSITASARYQFMSKV